MIVRCTSRAARIWWGGDIDGISVKFSDFYAAKKVKQTVVLFQGVLFKADFNKTLSSITQISHVNSRNLAIYEQKANMDDARFEEILSLYDRSDRR